MGQQQWRIGDPNVDLRMVQKGYCLGSNREGSEIGIPLAATVGYKAGVWILRDGGHDATLEEATIRGMPEMYGGD